MAFLLQLYETVEGTTLNFLGVSGDPHYVLEDGGFSAPAPPETTVWGGKSAYFEGETLQEHNFKNRKVNLQFAIKGSTRDKVAEGIRDLVRACEDIKFYAKNFVGPTWQLQYQWDGASEITYFDPLHGVFNLPSDELSLEKMLWIEDSTGYYVVHECTLTLVCDPLAYGSTITIENSIRNPSFEVWDADSIVDSQPACWSDYEHVNITGTNNRDAAEYEHGIYSLEIDVTNSTGANQYKGVERSLGDDRLLEPGEDYTLMAWVKNAAITNGTVRIEIEGVNTGVVRALDSGAANADFTRYAVHFTFHANDTALTVRAYINSDGAGCSGTAYIDKMMLTTGDWESDDTHAYMTGSQVGNERDLVLASYGITYLDVCNIPGDLNAKSRVEIVLRDPTSGSAAQRICLFRVGLRKYPNIFKYEPWADLSQPTLEGCFEMPAMTNAPTVATGATEWADLLKWYVNEDVENYFGKFRLLACVYSGGDKIRALSWMGFLSDGPNVGDEVTALTNEYSLVDLGILDFSKQGEVIDPGTLEFLIQAQAAYGNAQVWLYKALLMPVDGGYIVGKTRTAFGHPADQILIDGIAKRPSVVYLRADGRGTITGVPENMGGYALLSHKEKLHYAIWDVVYEFDGLNTWTSLGAVGDVPYCLCEFQGVLWAGCATLGKIFYYDGAAWQESYNSAATSIYCLRGFDSYLYAGGDDSGKIYKYTPGVGWAEDYNSAADAILCLESYQGRLFAGGDNGVIYALTPGAGWAVEYNTGEDSVQFLRTAHGYLYAGTEPDGKIYRFDDSAWGYLATPSGDPVMRGSAELEGSLYYATDDHLHHTEDGVTWNSYSLSKSGPDAMCAHDGMIWVGRRSGTPALNFLDNFCLIDKYFPVPDVVGKPFRLSPEIDQRLVFCFDQYDGGQDTGDRVNVRIAYEPQYLHIRGA